MEKIDEFRNALAGSIKKLSIEKIVQDICLHPEYLEDMYRLISDEKQTVSWRAIWACEKVSEKHPEWLVPLQEDIIRRLLISTIKNTLQRINKKIPGCSTPKNAV